MFSILNQDHLFLYITNFIEPKGAVIFCPGPNVEHFLLNILKALLITNFVIFLDPNFKKIAQSIGPKFNESAGPDGIT